MKYLKIFVLALMFMVTAASCGENSNDTEETQKNDSYATSEASTTNATNMSNTTETAVTAETDPIIAAPLTFVNTEANDLFNMIAENRSVWDREEKGRGSGTLVDLNFDGQPEFIVSYASGEAAVYKFNESEFIEWFSFLLYGDSVRISLYTDSTGKKGWVVPTCHEGNGYNEYGTSIFYCTGNSVTETVKLTEREYRTETVSGVIRTVEYYVDGKKLSLTDQQFQDYNNASFDSEEWWNVERTPENALWYYYNQEYISFTNNIANAASYPLIPGWPWAVYITQEHELYSPHGILYPLSLIANAYVSNDDYLMRELR